MRMLVFMCLALTMTASCSVVQNATSAVGIGQGAKNRADLEIDGVKFRARARSERREKRVFSVTANPFAVNPDAAVETAVYEATRYCILTFGGSDIEWTVGPDTPVDELPVDGNAVTLQGRCTQR